MKKILMISVICIICLMITGCREVTVERSIVPIITDKFSLEVIEDSVTNAMGRFILTNNSNQHLTYGHGVIIQKMLGQYEYIQLKPIDEQEPTYPSFVLLAGESIEFEERWYHIYGPLEPGRYMVLKQIGGSYAHTYFVIEKISP